MGWLPSPRRSRSRVATSSPKSARLPRFGFHVLRHTHASLLLAQGVNPKVVQERLGHSQIAITLDTYSHVVPSLQRDAAKQLDGLFQARQAPQ